MFYVISIIFVLSVLGVFVYRKVSSMITFDNLDLHDEGDEAEDIVVKACMKLKTEVTLNYENSIWIMRTDGGFGVGDTPEEAYVDLLDSIGQEELYNKNLSNF